MLPLAMFKSFLSEFSFPWLPTKLTMLKCDKVFYPDVRRSSQHLVGYISPQANRTEKAPIWVEGVQTNTLPSKDSLFRNFLKTFFLFSFCQIKWEKFECFPPPCDSIQISSWWKAQLVFVEPGNSRCRRDERPQISSWAFGQYYLLMKASCEGMNMPVNNHHTLASAP